MGKLQKFLFIAAYVFLWIAFGLESGSGWFSLSGGGDAASIMSTVNSGFAPDDRPSTEEIAKDIQNVRGHNDKPPGYGVPDLVLTDGILLLSMTWMILSLFATARVQGRLQGGISLVAAVVVGFISVLRLMMLSATLTVMLSLFLAPPFGTLVYLAIWGFFAIGTAKVILSIAMFAKIVFAVLLVVAQPRFLKVKSLILLLSTSLVLTFVVMLLHGIVPSFLASVTDAIAGIVDAVAGLIWAIVLLITSTVSILRAIRVDRGSAGSDG